MGRHVPYSTLEDHPHLADVRALLGAVPHLTDVQLRGLAARWRNAGRTAAARAHALSPDTVLVVDVLRAFGELPVLFADDLEGQAPYLGVEAGVVGVALKAVRDAIAGVMARPVLSRGEFVALTAPWRCAVGPPEVGSGQCAPVAVQGLLTAASGLATRCHDPRAARTWDGLLVRAMTRDEGTRDVALREAFGAAVLSERRRVWALLRHHARSPALAGRCGWCTAPAADRRDGERVGDLVADAFCGLLVADLLSTRALDALLAPLAGLIPVPRSPSDV